MTQNTKKQHAATEALKYVQSGSIIGVGTGSTVNFFIDGLVASTERLKKIGIPVFDLNDVESFDIYVDGADEINPTMDMIKGGGDSVGICNRNRGNRSIASQFAVDYCIRFRFMLPC